MNPSKEFDKPFLGSFPVKGDACFGNRGNDRSQIVLIREMMNISGTLLPVILDTADLC